MRFSATCRRESQLSSARDPFAGQYQTDFPTEELRRRRAAVLEAIGPSSLALVQGAGKNSTHDLFRQANDFYYLSGLAVPHAYLLLDGRSGKSALFLPHQDSALREREGDSLCAENAERCRDLTGIEEVLGTESLAVRLEGANLLHIPIRQLECADQSWDTLQRARQDAFSDPWDGHLGRVDHFIRLVRERCPKAEVKDLSPVLDGLRLAKSSGEIALMRKAGLLAARGLMEAMRCTRPGVLEYQLDAAIRYGYLVSGARGSAYRSIVAGEANAWYGHYTANDCVLCDGDLVLVDTGPDYHLYSSDATRMWPVNGRYSPVQRELYGFIVEYHKTLLGLIRPGITDAQLLGEAAREMAKVIERTRFSKSIYEAAARRALEFPHLTHSVGLAVHDVGTYKGKPMPAGTVFALDPQLIIPEERLYIRVEDTVAVTETGVENLTSAAPLELADVEKLMREPGMLASFPAWT